MKIKSKEVLEAIQYKDNENEDNFDKLAEFCGHYVGVDLSYGVYVRQNGGRLFIGDGRRS